MKQYVGLPVIHKSYGSGQIVGISGNKITLSFDGVEKKFVFPDVFEKFVLFEDEEIQKDILILIEQKKEEEELQREKERIEYEEKEKTAKKEAEAERKMRGEPQKSMLSKGECFATHADVLNACFGFDFKHFQQGYKVVDESYAVWFPTIASKVEGEYVAKENSYGWVNVLSEKDTVIIEKNEDTEKNISRDERFELDRFVFAKYDEGYKFLGVYRSERMPEPWVTGYKYRLIATKVDLEKMLLLG